MPEVLTEDHPPSVDYKVVHLLPQLRASTENAGCYIAANLQHNADVPEAIALAIQDVVEAYDLPITISTVGRDCLKHEVIDKAKQFTSNEMKDKWDALVAYRELCGAVDALIEFESSLQQKG